MFSSCTSLTTAPALPATTLADSCYSSMFYWCSALTTAPELPATTLVANCYNKMFYRCSSLNSITLGYEGLFSSAPTGAFTNWVDMVSSSGTIYYNGIDTTRGVNAIPEGWSVVVTKPFHLIADTANVTVGIVQVGTPTLG